MRRRHSRRTCPDAAVSCTRARLAGLVPQDAGDVRERDRFRGVGGLRAVLPGVLPAPVEGGAGHAHPPLQCHRRVGALPAGRLRPRAQPRGQHLRADQPVHEHALLSLDDGAAHLETLHGKRCGLRACLARGAHLLCDLPRRLHHLPAAGHVDSAAAVARRRLRRLLLCGRHTQQLLVRQAHQGSVQGLLWRGK
eukprot:scaffold30377_cov36-Phaeocystis_antarctica.AAC.2